jgi:hypothetical protein
MNLPTVMFFLVMGLLALNLIADLIERVNSWRKRRAAARALARVFAVRLPPPQGSNTDNYERAS